jgi:uncharacterized membrane protein YkvA (DUF1232 family)
MANFSLDSVYTWYRDLVGNPKYRWWVIGGTLVYLLSPIDVIPDIFPIVGQIDDAIVVTLLATEIGRLLMDRSKNIKQKADPTQTPTQSQTQANAAEMVDVSAVEVK